MPFSPTGIVGCIVWISASGSTKTNGLLPDNTPVTYLTDLSNHSNNYSCTAGNSGTWVFPLFENDHDGSFGFNPYIHFSGTANLANVTSNNINLSTIAAFSVYRSPSGEYQPIISNWQTAVSQTVNFVIGHTGIAPPSQSGAFAFNNDTISFVPNSSIAPNKVIIRSDRHRSTDGQFINEYWGVPIGSGTVNLSSAGINNYLGYYQDKASNKSYFQGDLAELIIYNSGIAESDAKAVNNYLIQKYLPGSALPPTLYQADYFSSDYSFANYFDPDYWDLLPNFTSAGGVTQKSITASLVVDTVLNEQLINKSKRNGNLVTDINIADSIIRHSKLSINIAENTDFNIKPALLTPSYAESATIDVATDLRTSNIRHKIAITENFSVQTDLSLPAGSSTPFVLPSDLGGLFGWYRSTSIGVTGVDGSPVVYWPDDSGSGNNLTYHLFQSGVWAFPGFYRNQINGYPSVRWINTPNYSYLSTNSTNPSLIFSSGDFTGFVVFRTSDVIDKQCIYSLDSLQGIGNCGAFEVNINDASNGFGFSYGNGSELITTANSPTFGTHLYDANTFMIRHDRFRQGDGKFFFGRYGADIASGTTSTFASVNNQLNLGASTWLGNPFIGDIAEVIMYRRKMSDYEVELVNTYLLLKYRPSNVGTVPLFLYSNTDNNSGIYNDRPLYIQGSNFSTSGSTSLYIGSANISMSGQPLYTISIGNPSGVTPLYVAGNTQQFPPVTLYVGGSTVYSGSMVPLYTNSSRFISNNTTLYISGSLLNSSSGTIPLFIGSAGSSSGVGTPSDIYLYIAGWAAPTLTGNIPLFLDCNLSSNTPGLNNLYNHMPLYIEAGKSFTSMPLYLQANPTDTHNSGWMPLFIGSPIYTGYYAYGVDLFLANNVSGYSSPLKRLYIKGDGSLVGGSIATASMPLFLKQSGITPTIIGLNNSISLYTDSALSGTNYAPLYTNSASTKQSGVSLYIFNSLTGQSGVSLFIPGRNLALTNNIPTFIHGF